jgi:hypothetical protein
MTVHTYQFCKRIRCLPSPVSINRKPSGVGIALDPLGTEDEHLCVLDMDGLAEEIGDFSRGGLNCNLEPETAGKKRRTGAGILARDDWLALIRLFKKKGIPADPKEVQERADDDELFHLDVVKGAQVAVFFSSRSAGLGFLFFCGLSKSAATAQDNTVPSLRTWNALQKYWAMTQ